MSMLFPTQIKTSSKGFIKAFKTMIYYLIVP